MSDWFSTRIFATLTVTLVFFGLTAALVFRQGFRSWITQRTRADWLVDTLGLSVQGTLIPLLQMVLAATVLKRLAPSWEGVLNVPGWLAFVFCFVGVDYAYYWNHRFLHSQALWPLHQVHHSARTLDAWVSSRNTLWTSFVIVYLWLNGALIFLTGQQGAIVVAAALTSALDLWRHSGFALPARADAWASHFLITPTDHAWHHSTDVHEINFGANFNLWDRLHGTYRKFQLPPDRVGIRPLPSLFKTLFWPYP